MNNLVKYSTLSIFNPWPCLKAFKNALERLRDAIGCFLVHRPLLGMTSHVEVTVSPEDGKGTVTPGNAKSSHGLKTEKVLYLIYITFLYLTFS